MSYSATYEPEPRESELTQAASEWLPWAIVVAFGLWAAWGWLVDGFNALSLLLAVVFGLFQVATNVLAVHVRSLARRGDILGFLTCLAAMAAMVATGLITHEGLNHAYAEALERGFVNADPQLMSWLLLSVPYLEPLMFWINKLLSEPVRERAPRRQWRGLIPWLITLIVGAPVVAAADTGPPSVDPPRPNDTVVRLMPKRELRNITDPNRAQARLLLKQGRKPGQVHRETGVPLATLKRWAKEAA